ncbi:FHA domain protein [Dictyocaulus viviparus]|uniref:FHA domain protein n=1 Tax=Dictyocaulus viviparus TaxID=29172 RepID=A0A0D8XXW5_DICVI|nr:FHA domain protein [Dictyocaulus viviparus]
MRDRWSVSERWGSGKNDDPPVKEKEKVNLGVSGKLAEDTNMYRGVLIKYNEPPEAKKPTLRWRLYPFKGDEALPVLHIHRQSAYLIGRDRKIADLPIDHPSCSKQHAVLQYRSVPFERADGTKARRVLPYIIDLGSSNGTLLNGSKIEPQRYVELKEKDVLKFGFSSREFVVLNEKSAGDVNASDSEQGSPASD